VESPPTESSLLKFLNENFKVIVLILIGLFISGVGFLLMKSGTIVDKDKIEIINTSVASESAKLVSKEIVVEIAGAIEKPGVYKLEEGSRIQDLLVEAGGLSEKADRDWVNKNINLAAKQTDSQKVYVYSIEELKNNQSINQSAKSSMGVSGGTLGTNTAVSGQSDLVNINSATLTELDKLPGIGPVYGQKIIEYRPYSSIEELVSKGALKQNVFEKIKDLLTI